MKYVSKILQVIKWGIIVVLKANKIKITSYGLLLSIQETLAKENEYCNNQVYISLKIEKQSKFRRRRNNFGSESSPYFLTLVNRV